MSSNIMIDKDIKWGVILIISLFLGTASMANAQTAHMFEFNSIDGGIIPLSQYEGKVILVVNTASKCGFTNQYEGLQNLWEKYQHDGLVVLGVPSNDFGGQEPGSDAQIKDFCEVNFNLDFPMTAKIKIKGKDGHPFYKWVGEELGWTALPKWNFHKYLITKDGQLHDSYSSLVKPESSELTSDIRLLIARAQ
ncbi:glutathione peroxidase [Alphaproteobacteria bacterium]|jgi:glutathione peroxidase|nr:glutathione peroxidase [Alphaproteobacteria bacterium]MDC3311117.1 glutathione peroxidase [Alphaproteobacteria bacterium]